VKTRQTTNTPGPWNLKIGTGFEYEYQIRDSEKNPVAYWPVYAGQTKKTAKANALLMAKAPELLDALESVWLWMGSQSDAQSKGGHATFDLMALREQRDIAGSAILKATRGAS
jgi:hypothetical protein